MAKIETIELEKQTKPVLQKILEACEIIGRDELGLKDFYTGTETWSVPELGLSYKNTTSDEFKRIVENSTNEKSFRRAYAHIYEQYQSNRTDEVDIHEQEKPATEANLPDEATRRLQAEEAERIKKETAASEQKAKEQTAAEIEAREKVAAQKRAIQEQIDRARQVEESIQKKLYIKVDQPSNINGDKYKTLKDAADANPPQLVDQISAEIGTRMKNTDHGGLSEDDIDYLSRKTAYQFVEGVRGNSAAVKAKVMQKIVSDQSTLDFLTSDPSAQKDLRGFADMLIQNDVQKYFESRRITEAYLGKDMAEWAFGEDPSKIGIEISNTFQEGYREYSPSDSLRNIRGVFEGQGELLSTLNDLSYAEIKRAALRQAGIQLSGYIAEMAPESFIYQAYNTELVQGILSITGLGAPISWTSTNFFGQLAIDAGYGNLFGFLGKITGFNLGVTEAPIEAITESFTEVPIFSAETIATPGSMGASTLMTTGTQGASTLMTTTGEMATTTIGTAAPEIATTVATGATTEVATTEIASAAGTVIAPGLGTIVGAIIGFIVGLIGGKILSKLFSKISDFIRNSDLGKLFLALPVAGIAGIFGGFGIGVLAGGITYGGLALAENGITGLSAASTSLFAGIAGAISGTWALFMEGVGTPILVTLISFPLVVAFIFLVINNSAYVVPQETLGNALTGSGQPINCSSEKGPVGIDDGTGPNSNSPIANRAWKITYDLYQGFWCFWNRSPVAPAQYFPNDTLKYAPGYPDLFNYTLYKTNPNGAEGSYGSQDMFWCTWLIVKAYHENGNNIGTYIYVPDMYNDFVANHHKMIKAEDATPSNIVPGAVVFYQVQGGQYSDRLNHVAIVYKVDPAGWDIVESNSSVKHERIAAVNPANNGSFMQVRWYGLP